MAAAGDSSTNLVYRGYLSFDISAMTGQSNVDVSSATLNAQQTTCLGNPFAAGFGGAIEAWHVYYGASLTSSDCSPTNINNLQYTLSNSLTTGLKTVSVIGKVQDDYDNSFLRGSRSQFLIRTATIFTSGTSSDYCSFGSFNQGTSSNDPYLQVSYEYD